MVARFGETGGGSVNMKRKNILAMLLIALIAAGLSVTTASASVGDGYGVMGFGLGWILLGGVGVVIVLAWGKVIKKAALKPITPILAVLVIAGLVLQFVDMPVDETAGITPDIEWSVVGALQTYPAVGCTLDNNARSISLMAVANTSSGRLMWSNSTSGLDIGWGHWMPIVINFSVTPTQTAGVTDLTSGATTLLETTDPGKVVYAGGQSYDLIAKDSSGIQPLQNWTYTGTTEYGQRYITTQFGASGSVLLTINYNEAGVSKAATGKSFSFAATIAEETWTITLTIVNQFG